MITYATGGAALDDPAAAKNLEELHQLKARGPDMKFSNGGESN